MVGARVLAAVALTLALGACARGEFEDRTAVVKVGGSTETYDVVSCGRDGETVFVVAQSPSGGLVQAVLGLDEDDEGVPASTGITIDADPRSETSRVAAFGAESWERRGSSGPAPGSITSARLRGSRIQLSGDALAVDAKDQPVSTEPVPVSLDARCDEQDDPPG